MVKAFRPKHTAWHIGIAALVMFAAGFAVVPFYGFLCRVAGLQTVQTSAVLPVASTQSDRFITVRFDARVQSDLPWEFAPEERVMRVRVGQWQDARFRVHSLTDRTITAQAIPSVVPWQATPYFSKAECFCFRQQTLPGGETRELPLRFVVSPDLPAGTDSITVSYGFMALR